MPVSDDPPSSPHPGRFATTRWTLVVAAGAQTRPESRAALAQLCETYWYPVYAYVRRRGHSADDAADLTQAFFAELLEKQSLAAADRDRGRFRAFLLTVLKRFLGHERDRARAQKRGGGRRVVSLDISAAEGRYQLEPAHDATPDRLFERRWALTLLEQVLARLADDYAARGKSDLFEHLKVFLTGSSGAPPYAEVAAGLGMTESAVKVAVHRLRQRYRDLLHEEIAATIAGPEDVGDELSRLMAALSAE
jgi:RNA polymerase sigma factor (sigma-70 family)